MSTEPVDVTLILEGTYPYVAGGVSTWVHQILGAYPQRRFGLLHIGAHPGAYEKAIFEVPANVAVLEEVHCRGLEPNGPRAVFVDAPPPRREPSRVLRAIRRLHLGEVVDDQLIADFASGDLTVNEFLHGDDTFQLLRNELYDRLCGAAPFMDFFWHFRAMHVPLLRLLAAPCPAARCYHAVSTGYAGLVGAIASYKTGRPLVVTEHGLYARERELELARASWIQDLPMREASAARPSPLRSFWSHYFRMLSRIAYHQATRLVTLSEANRRKQLADGADPAKIDVVPNGVRTFEAPPAPRPAPIEPITKATRPKLHVGFVGRVVPIKDVATLIRAIAIARDQVDLQVSMIGPEDEDATYAKRCHQMVKTLGLEDIIKFVGPKPREQIYVDLDVVVLTSLSEGQPLVMLEAYAAGVPVIATDVGACREMIEGGDEVDKKLGPSGICTRVASPLDTANALVAMASDPARRLAMGKTGLARVHSRYQLHDVVARYDELYARMAA